MVPLGLVKFLEQSSELAVVLLDFKVRVEVEDNLLVGFGGVDNPLTVLVRGIVLGVTWGGDVASILGIQPTSAGWVWLASHFVS